MPMHNIPNLQTPRMLDPHIPTPHRLQRVLRLWMARPSGLFEDVGTRVRGNAVDDALPHEVDVVGRHALGVG